MKKILEILKNKWLIKGTTTIALIAIVIACYILLNWGMKKVKIEDIDFTEKKLYSLSDETKSKIKDLNKDVTIQLINMGSESYAKEYAEKYSKASKFIKLDEVTDLDSRLDLKTKYNLQNDEGGIIVVSSGEKEKTITTNDLYTVDYSTYEQIDRTEEAITNAIVEVVIEKKPKIYILSGNSQDSREQPISLLTQKLKDDSNEIEYLDILVKGSVPEDCDCLVITTLSKDLTELEKNKLLEYINNGGKIVMLTSQNVLDIETPFLNEVLSKYGMSIPRGVVFEQNTDKMLQNAPFNIIADVNASFMNDLDMNMKMCFIQPGKINLVGEDKLKELGIETETLASSSDKSFLRTNYDIESLSRTDSDSEEGSNILAAHITKKISDEKKSELIIYTSELSASNLIYNNEDIILNSISYLTDRKDTITIRKSDQETEKYAVTKKQHIIIELIIFTLPVIIIIVGIIIWLIRRRRY